MDKRLAWAGAGIVSAILVVAALAAFGLGPFSRPGTPPPSAQGNEVHIVNYSYAPVQLTVPAGTTINWTNLDPVDHTVTEGAHGGMNMGGFDSGTISQNQTFRYTFDMPGTYEYHCDPHPNMMGTITVTA